MIDPHLFYEIKRLFLQERLNAAQIASHMNLDARTVSKYLQMDKYTPRQKQKRVSKLDPFKGEIVRLLHLYPYSAEQIFQRMLEAGFEGRRTIVKDFVAEIRPARIQARLSVHYDKGECAQVDWGSFGVISTGSTNRKLSFFTMILGYSRMLFVHFTVLETMEQFLECLRRGLEFFGGVPRKIVIDNLKTGVLSHQRGQPPVFHPRFQEMGDHYGFKPVACNPRSPQEKGMVEKAVSFVKGNFLNGHEYPTLDILQSAAGSWLNSTANVRVHSVTGKKPVDLLEVEKPYLTVLNLIPYDTSVLENMRASCQFRVTLDTNRYSVPWRLAGRAVKVKRTMDTISIFHEDKLVARHARSYDRRRDFEDPDHVKDLLLRRKKAQNNKLLTRFLSLHLCAEEYYRQLCRVRGHAMIHIRKIMALHDRYGTDNVAQALQTALHFSAYSSDYIHHLLTMSERSSPEPGPLHLTTPGDALELDVEPPDLNQYTP